MRILQRAEQPAYGIRLIAQSAGQSGKLGRKVITVSVSILNGLDGNINHPAVLAVGILIGHLMVCPSDILDMIARIVVNSPQLLHARHAVCGILVDDAGHQNIQFFRAAGIAAGFVEVQDADPAVGFQVPLVVNGIQIAVLPDKTVLGFLQPLFAGLFFGVRCRRGFRSRIRRSGCFCLCRQRSRRLRPGRPYIAAAAGEQRCQKQKTQNLCQGSFHRSG